MAKLNSSFFSIETAAKHFNAIQKTNKNQLGAIYHDYNYQSINDDQIGANCHLVEDLYDPVCCKKKICHNQQNHQNETTNIPCHHSNQTYKVNETFNIGCELKCLCQMNGQIECQPRCFDDDDHHGHYHEMYCHLRPDPDDPECCKISICDYNNSTIDQHKFLVEMAESINSTTIKFRLVFFKNLNSNDIEVPVYIEKQEDFLNKREVKIRIPEDLKTILTDDWELIINQKKLVHLPFKLNIDKILNDYYFNKSQAAKLPSNHTLDGYIDFLNAIRRYFNFFLDKCLLYPSEKQQMEYLIKNYDEFSKTAKSDPSNSKDSKRLLKKFRKATPKSGNNRFPSSSNRTNESENNNQICIKSSRLPLLFNDQNSQTSETSDSCSTSTEVSSTELQQCQQQNKLDSATMMNMNDKRIDFTKLYGAVHLLRLFTKLGQFLFYTDLNSERINLVNSYIYDFLKYLSKNLWLFANESDTSYIDSFLLDRNTR